MTISPRFLDEIRSRLVLSDIIGQRVRVTRAGREFKACCPFHKEKTPSFTINDDKGFYHCFGCGAHGDVVNFVMQHDNLPFPEAVEQLAARAGLQVPKSAPEDVQKAKRTRDLYALMDAAALWMQENLWSPANRNVLEYVQQRGFGPETMQGFRIGYAPADRQVLRNYLKGEGYSDAQMIEAGLIKKSDRSAEPYAFFRERIMIPVTDRQGRVIAFGGRILPDHMRPPDQGDYKPAKYMNSGETPIFDKGRVLFGESHARHAAAQGAPIIVAEGYFDVIALHQAGFKGAVAPMGTALTESQIALLWKMIPAEIKEPVLCFDGDNAGRKAALRALERFLPLLAAGQSAKIAFLPEGEDPDSLIKTGGAAAFSRILDGAQPLIEYLWQSRMAGRSVDTPEKRAALVASLNADVRQIADREVQKQYDIAIRARVSDFLYKNRMDSRPGGKFKDAPSQKVMPPLRRPSLKAQDLTSRILLAAVVNHPQIFEIVEEELGALYISEPRLERLRRDILSVLAGMDDADSQGLRRVLADGGHGETLDIVLSQSTYLHGRFAAPGEAPDTAQKWRDYYADSLSRHLDQELKAGWQEAFDNGDTTVEDRTKSLLAARRGE